jgi:glycosyltransferase involved in cell wall biosynthesis
MMIHHNALKHFDIFREGESAPEYCLRINRYGYSTVLCNRAFVGRLGAGGQCPTAEEWATYLAFHVDPVEYFSSLSVPHKPRILFDLSHLKPHYYGTAEFGLTLLREIHLLMQNTVDMVVDIHPSCRDFFLPELHGYQFYDPQSEPKVFDLAFKPTQINSWEELERLNRRAPRVAYTIQDMIAVRCSYLGSPGRDLLFREAAELSDQVFTISQSVVDDFNAITGSHRKLEVIHHGTTFGVSARERCAGDYILIMGNSYVHKGIAEALTALEGINLPVIVIGKAADPGFTAANVRCLTSGALSREKVRELLAGARIFVYPSHYEGFGLPVLDALALGKPVVVLDNQTNRELLAITRSSNLHVLQTVNELKATVDRLIRETPNPVQRLRRWRDAGRDYSRALQDMLSRPINTQLLRTRWTLLQERGL